MWFLLIVLLASANAFPINIDLDTHLTRISNGISSVFDSVGKFTMKMAKFLNIDIDEIDNRMIKLKKAFVKFGEIAFEGDVKPIARNKMLDDGTIQIIRLNSTDASEVPIDELVKSHDHVLESHQVITMDGYVLTLHRILSSRKRYTNIKRKVVLLHHGLLGSSEDWLLLGAEKALPYILVRAGYDVWLANARGSPHSRMHTSKSIKYDQYWDFSFHEMGQYDLPAVVDYIKYKYDTKIHLHFIGHSMGSTALMVLLSLYPRYNKELKSAVLLAPMVYMYEVKGPLRLLADIYRKSDYFQYESIYFLKHDGLAPTIPLNLINGFCRGDKVLCTNPLLLLANGGLPSSDESLRRAIVSRSRSGLSVKTIIHYIQLVKSGQFQMYNFGEYENYKMYGKPVPPAYSLSDVTLPVAVFSSSDDCLASSLDIKSLLKSISNVVMHKIVDKNKFSHTDFVWGEDADDLVYKPLVDILKKQKCFCKNKNIQFPRYGVIDYSRKYT